MERWRVLTGNFFYNGIDGGDFRNKETAQKEKENGKIETNTDRSINMQRNDQQRGREADAYYMRWGLD